VRTVLIVDDHPLFRDALKMAVLATEPGAEVRTAASASELYKLLATDQPLALVLLDLRMPDSSGFAALLRMRAERPQVPVIVVTAEESAEALARAQTYGAAALVNKSAELSRISQTIRAVLDHGKAGFAWPDVPADATQDTAQRIAKLSPTQLRVLMGVLEGRLNKQIAYDLGVSEVTVKAHMTAVFRKLGVLNRTQAVLAARSIGLSPQEAIPAE
jgi:DNA-binding NarL/FixJ family response regulator